MRDLARIRKAVVATIGFAVSLVLLVPEDAIPEAWRPWVGLLLAVGTVAGVYRVRNDPPAARAFPTRFERHVGYPPEDPEARPDPPPRG